MLAHQTAHFVGPQLAIQSGLTPTAQLGFGRPTAVASLEASSRMPCWHITLDGQALLLVPSTACVVPRLVLVAHVSRLRLAQALCSPCYGAEAASARHSRTVDSAHGIHLTPLLSLPAAVCAAVRLAPTPAVTTSCAKGPVTKTKSVRKTGSVTWSVRGRALSRQT